MNDRSFSLTSTRPLLRRVTGAVCALLFLAALIALGVWAGGWLRQREEFVARITEASDLTKSSPVMMLGQPIGRVSAVRIVPGEARPVIEARFWIAREHVGWMRQGTRAIVRSNLLGAPWIEIAPGPTGGTLLAAGAVLETDNEQGALQRVLELQPIVQDLIAQVGGLIETLNSTTQRMDPILAKVDGQLDSTRGSLEQLNLLLQETRGLFDQFKDDQSRLVDGLTTTLAKVNGELLPNMDAAVRDSRKSMVDTMSELNETLTILETRLPGLMETTQAALQNTRDLTEAAAHTWPFSNYWRRKEREAAAAAARAAPAR